MEQDWRPRGCYIRLRAGGLTVASPFCRDEWFAVAPRKAGEASITILGTAAQPASQPLGEIPPLQEHPSEAGCQGKQGTNWHHPLSPIVQTHPAVVPTLFPGFAS